MGHPFADPDFGPAVDRVAFDAPSGNNTRASQKIIALDEG
jgi:hypothetical protein